MGVPKFFRFIGERYPCLCELVRENQVKHRKKFNILFNLEKLLLDEFNIKI